MLNAERYTLKVMNLTGYKAFLSLGYWFNVRPVSMPKSWIVGLCIFFGLFILGGITASVLSVKSESFLAKRLLKFSRLGWTTGILGYIWVFFSYEEAVVMGARFWFLFIVFMTAIWAGFILNDIRKNMAKERTAQAEKERFEKYLPKKKK